MKRKLVLALGCSVSLLAMSTEALAQAEATPDLRLFEPSLAPTGGLMIAPTNVPETLAWNAGHVLWADWRPLTLRNADGGVVGDVVRERLGADWWMNLGVGRGIALGIRVPAVVAQGGERPQDNDYVRDALKGGSLVSNGMGDVAVTGQVTILSHGDMGGFGLAALATATLPTGDEHALFAEGAAGGTLKINGEYAVAGTALRASAGLHVRGRERTFSGTTWGNEIPWALGATLKPQALGLDASGRWSWSLEAFGALPVSPDTPFSSAPNSPAMLSASTRYRVGEVDLLTGAQVPLDVAAGVPAFRLVFGLSWAPRTADQDHDGVDDAHDECPELEEDRDGFEDQDGCPDFDNDSDGIPDTEDACPNQPDDDPDAENADGCPGGTSARQ